MPKNFHEPLMPYYGPPPQSLLFNGLDKGNIMQETVLPKCLLSSMCCVRRMSR